MIDFNSSEFISLDGCMYVSNTLHQQILSSLIMMFLVGVTIGLFMGINSFFIYEVLKHKFFKYTHR